MQVKSFKPILDEKTKVFIIGTMPSVDSLRECKYYAHAQNAFWPFIKEILDLERYDYTGLLKHKIGLWDSLKTCQRQGSLDSSIKNKVFNDFSQYPQIKYYLFTSKNAYNYFIQNKANKGLLTKDNWSVLPSPSPTYARMSKSEKLKIWQRTFTKILKQIQS